MTIPLISIGEPRAQIEMRGFSRTDIVSEILVYLYYLLFVLSEMHEMVHIFILLSKSICINKRILMYAKKKLLLSTELFLLLLTF